MFALAPAMAAGETDGLTDLRLRLDWLPAGYQAPYYLAEKNGWFKEAGLKVDIVDGNGSSSALQLVRSGDYDAATASLSTMAVAKNKGLNVISIAGFFRKGDLTLMVPADSDTRKPSDIKGKKIGYTIGSLETPFIDAFLKRANLTRDDVRLINVDATAKTAMYVNGSSDGYFASALGVARVMKVRPSRNILFADYGLNLPGLGLVASEDRLRSKGAALRKLASVLAGSWAYVANGHAEEAVQAMLQQRQGVMDVDIVREQLKSALQLLTTPSTQNLQAGFQADADWTSTIHALEDAELIGPNSRPGDYFTNDYLDEGLIKSLAGR